MSENETCPNCGAELPPKAPAGLCPKCLLGAGISDSISESPDNAPITADTSAPPEVDTIPLSERGSEAFSTAPELGTKVTYFGDYELLDEIARGGMGIVYKARQVRLNRTVALKMILAGQFASEADVQRFHTEAEAAAQLDHPGIVPIFEVGEHDGHHFFSMGLVEGESLAARTTMGPLPPKEAAELVCRVAEAIEYAHDHGVIHRDLKPANILIDQHGQPRITDFGLAKRSEYDSGLTATGQILGTPGYMPPEQAGGQVDQVKESADVYSLGAVLYATLTGRPPFQSDNALDTLRQVLECEPIAPRVLNPKIPRDLETICLKCLEKDPKRRYPSASELNAELQRFLREEPILARPTSRVERTWRWCRRKPVYASLSAAAILLAAAVVLVAWRGAVQADRERDRHLYLAHMQLARHAWEDGDTRRVEKILDRYRADRGLDDLRGWEFNYLAALCNRDLISLEAFEFTKLEKRKEGWFPTERARNLAHSVRHIDRVRVQALQWAPNGVRLVAGCEDGSVRIWNTKTGVLVAILFAEPQGRIYSVAVSPQGERIAAAAIDNNGQQTLCIWNTSDNEQTLAIPMGRGGVPHVEFGGEGDTVLVSTGLTSIRRWDAATGKELPGPPRTSRNVGTSASGVLRGPDELSPDGRWLISRAKNGLHIRDAEDGTVAHTLRGADGIVRWSPDSEWLAWGPPAGWINGPDISVWNVAAGEPVFSLRAFDVASLAWSPNARHLATGGADQLVRVFDLTGREVATHHGHEDIVDVVSWHADGLRLASASRDGVIKIWDALAAQDMTVLNNRAVDPQLIAGFKLSQTVLSKATVGPRCLAWSPDSKHLAAGGEELTIWDVAARQPRAIIRDFDWVASIDWSSDSKWLVCGVGRSPSAGSGECFVTGFELATHRELFRLPHEGTITALCLSPDESWLATMENRFDRISERRYRSNKRVLVWDLDEKRIKLEETGDSLYGELSWDPDGRYLVSRPAPWNPNFPAGMTLGDPKSWDIRTGSEVNPPPVKLTPFPNRSPNGRRWIFALGERALELWDADTREVVVRLEAPAALAEAVWSPDGNWIATAADDGSILLWDGRLPTPETRSQRQALRLVKSLIPSASSKKDVIEQIQNDASVTKLVGEQALEFVDPLWFGRVRLPALRLVESLFAEPAMKSDVIARINDAPGLSNAIRDEAIALANDWLQAPSDLNRLSWEIVRFPGQTDERYQQALQAAQSASSQKPDDGHLLNTLGVAQYRLGRNTEALATLQEANQLNGGIPSDLAFIAMSLYQLGEQEQARQALNGLRACMSPENGKQTADARRFLREATELIEGESRE